MVRKADLVNCQFLKVGATVEFECHPDKQGLIAKKVKLSHQKRSSVNITETGAQRNFDLAS